MNRVELGVTRLRELLHGPKAAPLAQSLNLWSLADGMLVGVNLDFSTVFELEPADISLMDPERLGVFGTQAASFLNVLPPDSTLQFVVQVRGGDTQAIDEYRREMTEAPDEVSQLLVEKKCAHLEGKFIQKRRLFVVVSSRTEGAPQAPLLPIYRKPWREALAGFHARRLREHGALEQIVVERLENLGLKARRLDPGELLDYIFARLNPGHPGRLTPERLSPFRTLREQAALHPLREEFDHLAIGSRYFRGITMLRLPEQAHMGLMKRLLDSLWPDCDLVYTLDALDTEKAIGSLKLANNITRTLAFASWMKNYEAEQKHAELDRLITEIRGSAQRLFRAALTVVVQAESLEALDRKSLPVVSAFGDFGSALGVSDDMAHFRAFLQTIPGHGALNDRKFYLQTEAAAAMLPIAGTWRGSPRKQLLLETPRGELLGLDLFDPELPAKHGLILGTTGSGKSFTTNFLLSHFLARHAKNHVVVIDVGGSYRKLVGTVGGEYLQVELSERFGFNPFPPRAQIAPGGEFDGDAVAYLSLLVSRMCLKPGERVTVAEKAFLEKAIRGAYARAEEARLGDVRAELARLMPEHPGAARFVEALELWTTGMYGRLFNRPGALEIDSRVIVFDLQNLENHPDLQSVYFFVIRSLIWGKLTDMSLRKIVAIDEGWKFFSDPVGTELIENLYRTARKFNAAIYSISQSPKDFLDTPAANAIITNSYVKFVLKLTKGFELLPRFELNGNQVEAARHLQAKPGEFSDLLIGFGERSVVARIEPSPLEYWVCTTNAEDRLKEDRLRAARPELSTPQLLLRLAEGHA